MKLRWYNKNKRILEFYNEHKRRPRILLLNTPGFIGCKSCKFKYECIGNAEIDSIDKLKPIYKMCYNMGKYSSVRIFLQEKNIEQK